MDVFDCIETRRSVRKFERKDVPNELIAQILMAGTYAPSAGNTQEWEFIIVRDRETKRNLSKAALNQKQVEDAPVLIVVLANLEKISMKYKERGKNLYSIQDTAACIQNMLLVAHDLGLGACWVGAFDEDEVSDVLRIPQKLRPVAIITLGFPVPYEPMDIKPERISFERLTWQEVYGKPIDWFKDLGRQGRFYWKPLDQQIEELSRRIKILREEKKELEKKEAKITDKIKNVFRRKK
ncbi:MAG: nitroreductase family protein [Candidatus Aenigmatarchaeota archaeon]